MNQYPIWNQVETCIYKSNKSYGAKNTSHSTVLVGSSSKNSHQLVDVTTTRRVTSKGVSFRYYVDGICIKEMIFSNNNGRAGELLETTSIIPTVGIQ